MVQNEEKHKKKNRLTAEVNRLTAGSSTLTTEKWTLKQDQMS